jgi:hypothetical protein
MNRGGYAKTGLRHILGYYCRKFHVEREKNTKIVGFQSENVIGEFLNPR